MLMTTNTTQTNRLANEQSGYLLQHAHNPVDWYPWCEEAFEKARMEDKPVFLSIGYSTCHWCRVARLNQRLLLKNILIDISERDFDLVPYV